MNLPHHMTYLIKGISDLGETWLLLLAITIPETFSESAMLDTRIETGCIALRDLNGVDEFRLTEFTGRNLCLLCDVFYLLYCHTASIAVLHDL